MVESGGLETVERLRVPGVRILPLRHYPLLFSIYYKLSLNQKIALFDAIFSYPFPTETLNLKASKNDAPLRVIFELAFSTIHSKFESIFVAKSMSKI